MDDYDNKSLEELHVIARSKYNLEIPPDLQLGDAIEWLRFQDALVETRVEAGLKGNFVPSPKFPARAVNETQQVPTIIPMLTNPPDLPKGDANLPVIAPLVPTTLNIPNLPTIPIIPKPNTIPVRPEYYLNDENTLFGLHGRAALPWETDLATINNAITQENLETINPDAVFQGRVLHPDYRKPAGVALFPIIPVELPTIPFVQPITPGVPVILPTVPLIPIVPQPATPGIPKSPVRITTPPQSPVRVMTPPKSPVRVTTPPQSPVRVMTLPKSPVRVTTPPKSPVRVMTPPKSPVRVMTPPQSPVKVTTPPQSPVKVTTPPVRVITPRVISPVKIAPAAIMAPEPIAAVVVPTIPKPIAPVVVPTIPKPIAPIVVPTIPKPIAPVVVPTISKPIAAVVVPTIPKPIAPVVVPTIPKPIAPVVVPKPSTQTIPPVVPKPLAPMVLNPIVPKATVPMTLNPVITRPMVVAPIVPKPVTLNVMQPTGITLAVAPVIPVLAAPKTPFGPLTPAPPTVPQIPVSPEFQTGPQIAGFTTIRATTLTPTIPNIGRQGNFPLFNTQPTAKIPAIRMPTFNTAVAPVVVPTKRPTPFAVIQQGPRAPAAPGTAENAIVVFNEINPDLLVGERTGKNKKGYSLTTLQSFAQRLGLTVSGKRKQELIDDIQGVRREMGLM